MDILNKEFLLFLSCAYHCKLKYMLIGGYAVNYYGYSKEDFTKLFVATIGPAQSSIDFLTFVHRTLDFDVAYQNKEIFEINHEISLPIVPYEHLKDMKLKAP